MNRIDVSPFEIQVFLEVAASGSFSRAAETSGLSQPAVSRAIGRLEQRLNIRLFDRTTRQVVLTPHGQTFLPIARRVVRDLTVSLDELGSYVSSVVGHVTVAALPSVAATLLPEALRRFHADYPAVTIAILDSFQDNVAGAVARGEADFGLSVQPPPTARLDFAPLVEDRFFAVLHRDDPLAAAEVRWSDLFARPFIAMRGMTSVRRLTDRVAADLGLTVEPALQASHPATAGAMIQAGLGVSALPQLTLKLLSADDLAIRPLTDPPVTRPLGILTRSGRTLPHLAKTLIDYLA
ncbi:LysR family transcriptional regulator [Paracoccus pantotrophus]|uniref:LysR family transcriptional regulator n=1 Tax=Paracoccus pantotrophus TaxID=82367 RepID=UPI0008F0E665|nr:LysR family transcriptional regulator [Paracoccus pantotrophus]MDF3856239.1 LysR family transcriptional regulator [Paracoccus pantotrophus]SFP02566.1 DNA-binding transcriptional regulator, LysR family [Paracoccus pantotrophus]